MPGVREQRQRSGQCRSHYLDQHHSQGDGQDRDQPFAVAPCGRYPVRMVVVVSHAYKASPRGDSSRGASVPAELVQAFIVDAEVVGNFVDDSYGHLMDHFVAGVTDIQDGLAEDGDAVRQ